MFSYAINNVLCVGCSHVVENCEYFHTGSGHKSAHLHQWVRLVTTTFESGIQRFLSLGSTNSLCQPPVEEQVWEHSTKNVSMQTFLPPSNVCICQPDHVLSWISCSLDSAKSVPVAMLARVFPIKLTNSLILTLSITMEW